MCTCNCRRRIAQQKNQGAPTHGEKAKTGVQYLLRAELGLAFEASLSDRALIPRWEDIGSDSSVLMEHNEYDWARIRVCLANPWILVFLFEDAACNDFTTSGSNALT